MEDSTKNMYPEVHYGAPPPIDTNPHFGVPQPTGPVPNYGGPQPINGYGQQPIPGGQQSNVTVVVQQPITQQNKLLVTDIKGSRAWSSSLFDCFSDVGNCFFTCCCYPCAICQLASRTGECFCTPPFVPASDINLRTRIRTLGGIQGTMCIDCITVSCCGPCAACQEARELTNMGIV